ncbi:hypothetical protein OIU79_011997 [Salix purpurea]|uniref:Uncharacterized protein n=1 Tax=Salix purpurea TaxID=77065 RepID=A0A9Q0Q233_SALPP|nr:hypothetical protein OIU79_011997 [Salix purpurea]
MIETQGQHSLMRTTDICWATRSSNKNLSRQYLSGFLFFFLIKRQISRKEKSHNSATNN